MMKWGPLGDIAARDPVYRKARAASSRPAVKSMVDEERLINLFMIIKFFLCELDSQNIIEFGSFRGGSAIFMATLLAEYYPRARVLSLDTFEGIPEDRANFEIPAQDFVSTNVKRIRDTARDLGLRNVEFVQGLVQNTGLEACRDLGNIGLAHFDVVLYDATVFAHNVVRAFMTPGGYLVQDDALDPSCPGATVAMEELIRNDMSIEQIWPHIVFRVGTPPVFAQRPRPEMRLVESRPA
jgi:predicted O-methyltransferase YrrM